MRFSSKRAITPLNSAESVFQAQFDQSPNGILIIDDDKCVDCNQAALNIFNCADKNELLGRTPGELSPALQSDGRDSRLLMQKRINDCQNSESKPFKWIFRDFSGQNLVCEVLLSPIKFAGHVVVRALVRDVSDCRRVEQKITSHEQQLQGILESSPIGIVVSDSDTGMIRFANKQFRQMLGLTDRDLQNPDKSGSWAAAIDGLKIVERLKRDGFASAEAVIAKSGGEECTVLVTSQYNPGNHEEILSWVIDVTEQKNSEHRLYEQDRVLHEILDNLPVALWVKDINDDYRYIISNKMNDELSGWSRGEALGRTDFDLDAHRDAEQYLQEDQEIARTGQVLVIPEEYPECADGKILIARTTKLAVPDADGNPQLIMGMREDITGRKLAEWAQNASEKRFRTLAANAPVGIFLTDAEGKCLFVNDHWQKMTGLSEEQAYREGWLKALHEDDRPDVEMSWKNFLAGQSEFSFECRFVGPGQGVAWVAGKAVAFKNDAGRVTGFLATITDISESKQLLVELQKSRDEANSANVAKSEFLSRMSHELRTPLNAVLGFGQILQLEADNLGNHQSEAIDHILAGGNHLLRLIEDVLDLARIDGGHLGLKMQKISTSEVILKSIAMTKTLAENKRIETVISDADAPDLIGDQQRVQQVLVNLLSNAIKYNKFGGRVEVTARTVSHGVTRISVKDSGIGIRREDWPRLFEPFERIADPDLEEEGTGIGLSICSKLVKLMGGDIGFESAEGVGSTFWFDLPGAGETEDVVGPAQKEDTPSQIKSLEATRILYVEDHQASIDLMVGITRNISGCEFLTATNASEGVALAKSSHPDLILMDINLPGLNGFEALELLKSDRRTQSIPVIALTANASPETREEGLRAGFADFLTKPFNLEDLFKAIAAVRQPPG